MIALAAGNIGLPEAARRADGQDCRALRFFARRLSLWTTGLFALYATAVAVGGGRVLAVLYGAPFRRFGDIAALIALAYVISALVFGPGVALKAAGHVRRLWFIRVAVAVASLLSVTILVSRFGLEGAGWAAVANTALYCAGVYLVFAADLSPADERVPTSWSGDINSRMPEGSIPSPSEKRREPDRITEDDPHAGRL